MLNDSVKLDRVQTNRVRQHIAISTTTTLGGYISDLIKKDMDAKDLRKQRWITKTQNEANYISQSRKANKK